MKKYFYAALIAVTILLVLCPITSKPATAEEQEATITSTIPSENYIVLNITGVATGDEVLHYIKAMDLQGNQIKRLKIVGDMTTYGNQGIYTFDDLEELELDGTSDVPSFLAYRAPKLTKLIDTSHTIKNIGTYAFAYSGLEDVELENVDFLNTRAFLECLSLTSFKSSSLRNMSNWAFSGSLTIFEAPNLFSILHIKMR
ncbi:leucine-rich repeat protein [Listeria grandensis]|uniref:Leucine-rich repeat protein n=1 Tax=Listeria grandensis TaxID=1494963 RepID=A0A7X0Y629_9LIST|nr:leucine-rich repeat protein [Listeria grandensis]MBC1937709.1 leucine-rich repeat protein [Listeria grandensis]